MIGLPEFGDKVRIWPFPGRKVQDGPRPLDKFGGGRVLADAEEGQIVDWTPFHLEQLRAGDILLHAPPKVEAKTKASPKPIFDPGAAAAQHIKDTAPEPEAPAPAPAAAKKSDKDKG